MSLSHYSWKSEFMAVFQVSGRNPAPSSDKAGWRRAMAHCWDRFRPYGAEVFSTFPRSEDLLKDIGSALPAVRKMGWTADQKKLELDREDDFSDIVSRRGIGPREEFFPTT